MRTRLRPAVFRLHLYLGLTLGLLLAIVGFSGGLLVFSHETDEWLHPQLLHARASATRAPVQPLLDELKRRYPTSKLQFIRVPQTPTGVYEVWLDAGSRFAYADPATGKILGLREARATLPGFLFELHTHLFLGETGDIVLASLGVTLFILGISGLVLWWPRHAPGGSVDGDKKKPGRWQLAFTIRWRSHPVRVAWDLHRVWGACTVLQLCLISMTGAALVLPDTAAALAVFITRDKTRLKKPKSRPLGDVKPISIDRAIATATATFPGAALTRITPALKKTAPIVIRLRFPTEMHPNGMSNIYIDQYSGKVLQAESALEAGPATRLMNLRYPLHTGRWAGLASRILQVFVGFGLAMLYVTGFYIWWKKTLRKRPAR